MCKRTCWRGHHPGALGWNDPPQTRHRIEQPCKKMRVRFNSMNKCHYACRFAEIVTATESCRLRGNRIIHASITWPFWKCEVRVWEIEPKTGWQVPLIHATVVEACRKHHRRRVERSKRTWGDHEPSAIILHAATHPCFWLSSSSDLRAGTTSVAFKSFAMTTALASACIWCGKSPLAIPTWRNLILSDAWVPENKQSSITNGT